MVLGAFGVHADEEQLRHLTDCSPLGTDAFQLIEAARQFGLTASRTYTGSSLPILGKGEQFPRVICILALLCSHYKMGL